MPSSHPLLAIVGGTYGERCAFPRYSEIYGSGLRAACALAGSGIGVEFHSAAEPSFARNVEMKAATFGFSASLAPTSQALWFSYLHTLAGGRLEPRPIGHRPKLSVSAENILQFGMIDADVTVNGKNVIYDPQSPLAPSSYRHSGSQAERLAIVLNRSEATVLTGNPDLSDAGRALLKSERAEVVVIKDGPRGAVVVDAKESTWIPPFATARTFLIGSGDIFTAAFAHEWGISGAHAVQAATRASIATAAWCSTGALPLVMDATKIGALPKPDLHQLPRPSVYLAGPFFSAAQLWWVSEARNVLLDLGLQVFSPYHDIGFVSPANSDVAARDLHAIATCDVVFALLDGFDPGTLFEVGYARSNGIPVIGLQTEKTSGVHETMLNGTGCQLHDDFGSAAYQAYWSPPRAKS